MADLYALPDATVPWKSEAELVAHVGSWRYQNDSAFREACEAKSLLGVPGASTRNASELEGRHDVMPEGLAEQAEAESAQQHGSLLIGGGMSRVTFDAGATVKASGEAAARAREQQQKQS